LHAALELIEVMRRTCHGNPSNPSFDAARRSHRAWRSA
jgi:hypothetical protein